eukprot:TRINITY_DN9654_c0_g3_i1.p2 TRINITY_DN9654_c0_g3~~TRINITY_DN9654_c0_g3_i1.p2  ORF type:complete len:113 (-),score=7.10 TRINITY_DN9654_c0_g3_i1:702-1040(-)
MYLLVAGRHPLYQPSDTTSTYLAKLKEPRWEFPEGFSDLAKDFFLHLVRADPVERYTAKEALEHPWITRRPGKIPLTYYESICYNQAKEKLIDVVLVSHYRLSRCCFLLLRQ